MFSGNNTFMLNAASNTASGVSQTYTFDTGRGATNYANLALVNGQTAYRNGDVTIGTGGSLLVSNTSATVTGLLTNQGSANVVGSVATFSKGVINAGTITMQNATINGGITNLATGTVGGNGTLSSGNFFNAGTLTLAGGQTLTLNSVVFTNTATAVVLGNSGTLLFNSSSFFNNSTNNLAWNLANGSTLVFSNGVNLLSAASTDLGASFASTNKNFFIANLNLAAGAQLNLATNATGHTALYVGTLTLAGGTTLNLDGLDVYYSTLTTNGATVNLGGGELVALGELPPQLLGWWQFDDGSGTTVADSSSLSNAGALFNAPVWSGGVFSNALAFDTNQWVGVPALPVYDLTKAMSLSVWLYLPANAGPVTIVGKGDGVTDGWALGLTDTLAVTLAMTATNGNTLTAALPVPTNLWTHVVTTFDGTNAVIYLNGTLVTNQTWTGNRLVNANGLVIGNLGSNGVAFALDDVRLYNYALSTNEIAALYNASTAGDGLPDWWVIINGLDPNDPTVATQTNANPWAHGLTNLEVYQNPSVLIGDNYSTLNDGLPDWWKVSAGLSLTDSNVASAANTSLPWANGTNNLAAYQISQIPPTITATITPAPNATGWNNTNVVVHFSATSTGSGIAWITSDITVAGATNDCEVTGYAMDNAGNFVSASVLVNIDPTPPVITLDPGDGQSLDQSHPLLLIKYADSDTNVPPQIVSAGLDLSTLQILLDSTDVTSNFYTFASGVVGNGGSLAAGTHTWSATVADMAGNVTSTSVTFTATGAINPNAPTMSSLNFVDDVTVMPDVREIWVQGQVSDPNASIAASVNGGEPVTMNKRGNVFGYLLPVELGTNVIVLVASGANGQNLSSKAFVVERSTRYRAAITSPEFGAYANGQPVTVSGYVSAKKDEGLATEEPLDSVTVNGVATTLDWAHVDADGNVPFTTVTPVPVATDGSPTALTLHIVWSSEDSVPYWYVEGYRITSKTWSKKYTEQYFFPAWSPSMPPPTGCATWSTSYGAGGVFQTNGTFDTSTTGEIGNSYAQWHTNNQCVATWNLDAVNWDLTDNYPTTTNPVAYTAINQPSFALEFGTDDSSQDWSMQGDGWSDEFVYVSRTTNTGMLAYNAPLHYLNQPVIFTFECLSATSSGTNVNWQDIQFRLTAGGPLANAVGPGQYVVSVSGGGSGYTIDDDSFVWPAATPQTVTTNYYEGSTTVYIDTTHHLSFTGFHNSLPRITSPAGSWISVPRELSLTMTITSAYYWDFQGVVQNSNNPYPVIVSGIAESETVFNWNLDPPNGMGGFITPQSSSPVYYSPSSLPSTGDENSAMVTARMWSNNPTPPQTTLYIYRDHLARDIANFSSVTNCHEGKWTTQYGTIDMNHQWNCFGSVRHAIDGTGNGWDFDYQHGNHFSFLNGCWSTDGPYYLTNGTTLATTNGNILSGLNRGDVVGFYVPSAPPYGFALQHGAIAVGSGLSVWAANNGLTKNNQGTFTTTGTWSFGIRSVKDLLSEYNQAFPSSPNFIRIFRHPNP